MDQTSKKTVEKEVAEELMVDQPGIETFSGNGGSDGEIENSTNTKNEKSQQLLGKPTNLIGKLTTVVSPATMSTQSGHEISEDSISLQSDSQLPSPPSSSGILISLVKQPVASASKSLIDTVPKPPLKRAADKESATPSSPSKRQLRSIKVEGEQQELLSTVKAVSK